MKHSIKLIFICLIFLALFSQCKDSISDSNIDAPTDSAVSEVDNPTDTDTLNQSADINLDWNEIEGADSYRVMISATKDFTNPTTDKIVQSTSYTATGLSFSTTYFWKVQGQNSHTEQRGKAVDHEKNSLNDNWTEVKSFTTYSAEESRSLSESSTGYAKSSSLPFPANGADKVSTNLKFQWEEMSGADEYVYELTDNQNFTSTIHKTTVSGSSYKPDMLVQRKRYYWRVRAAGDNTEWSDTWTFTTGTSDEEAYWEPPSTPTSTTVNLVSPVHDADKVSTNLTFKWEGVSGQDDYVYELTDNQNFTSTIHETTVSGTSYEPDMLVPRKRYYWRVRVAGDNTEWSDARTFTTGAGENDNQGSPDGDGGDNNDGGGDDTNDEPVTTEVSLISPVHNADKVSTDLTFKWEGITGQDDYVYELTDNQNFTSTIHETTVSGTSYKPDMLVPRKRYYWRVKAAGGDNTEWSDTRSFTTGAGVNDNQGSPDGDDGGNDDGGNNDGGGDDNNDEPVTTEVSLISPAHNADKVSTDLTFKWEGITGQDDYVYELTDNQNFTSTIHETTVSGTSYKPDMLVPRKRYYWRVKAAGGDNTEWSDARSFTTGAGENDNQGSPDGDGGSNDGSDGGSNDGSDEYPDWQKNADYVEGDIVRYEGKLYICVHANPGYDPIISNWFWDEYDGGGSNDDGSNDGGSGDNNDDSGDVAPPPPTSPPANGDFVTIRNGNFELNGEIYRFAGTNAYYLPNYEKLNSGVVDRAFDLFQESGVEVIRMWAFYDGYDCGYSRQDASENVIQTSPGEYSESALRDLDRVIAKGKEHGVRFIMPFINYWDQLGGICQYNTWAGASNPSTNMDFFINNSQTQKWFKDYISMLLNRVNTVTGVRYKDEPAILGWQIINEGRNSGQNPAVLRDWYREIAQYIKSIDSNHLLSTGEEGFDEGTPSEYSVGEYSNTYTLRAQEGTSYIMNTAIPEIDFGSAHWYPADYGFGHTISDNLLDAQKAWISDHKKIAESHGKPFYLGEFGIAGWGDSRVSTMYDALYQHAESVKLDGTLLWQLTADGTKCYEFGGNICYPGGRNDSALYNSFKNFIETMSVSKSH